jgi:hypothetical protein
MWKLAPVLVLAGLAGSAMAADRPDWAYPPAQAERVPVENEGDRPLQAPGSTRTYTRAQIDSQMDSPDWFPDEHPPMPAIVAHGNGTTVRACIGCHLPQGHGHPENSRLAGTTAFLPRAATGRLQKRCARRRRGRRDDAVLKGDDA